MEIVDVFVSLLGAFSVYCVFKLLNLCYVLIKFHLLPKFGFKVDLKKFGEWAVVTGGTDGIGKCYAEELAKRGLNIVLISRSIDKLNAVAKEIELKYKVKIKVLQHDFSELIGLEKLKVVLDDLDVGVLVNNVGSVGKLGLLYEELDFSDISSICNINMFAELYLTKTVLKSMCQKRKGVIIHVSSAYGYVSLGIPNLYPPTKAFVNSFTEALQAECEWMPDIHHQLVTPFYVYTNMCAAIFSKPSLFVPSASKYVESAVNTIGLTQHTFGYWAHEVLAVVFLSLPKFIIRGIAFRRGKRYLKERRLNSLKKKD